MLRAAFSHPVEAMTAAQATAASMRIAISPRHNAYAHRLELREEALRSVAIEQRIARLDAKEEAVARCEVEVRRVEHRMMKARQPVGDQHSAERGERGAEDRHLESRRNERRPAVQRPAA